MVGVAYFEKTVLRYNRIVLFLSFVACYFFSVLFFVFIFVYVFLCVLFVQYFWTRHYPAGNYFFKVNNINARTRREICPKLIIKTSERRHWHRSDVSIVNLEHILHVALVFLLWTLNRFVLLGTYQPRV